MNDVWQATQKETITHSDLVERLGCSEGHLVSWCVAQKPERLLKYPLVESVCFLRGQTDWQRGDSGATISIPAYHAGTNTLQLVAMIYGSVASDDLGNLEVSVELLRPFARNVMTALRQDINRARLSSAPSNRPKDKNEA